MKLTEKEFEDFEEMLGAELPYYESIGSYEDYLEGESLGGVYSDQNEETQKAWDAAMDFMEEADGVRNISYEAHNGDSVDLEGMWNFKECVISGLQTLAYDYYDEDEEREEEIQNRAKELLGKF